MQDFVRCFNDPESFPIERLMARFRLGRSGVTKRASEARKAGYVVARRNRTLP
jgi:hypothetical protein